MAFLEGKLKRWRIPQNMPGASLFPLCYSSYRCRASFLLGFSTLESGYRSLFLFVYPTCCRSLWTYPTAPKKLCVLDAPIRREFSPGVFKKKEDKEGPETQGDKGAQPLASNSSFGDRSG
jgi:hypothetical protein